MSEPDVDLQLIIGMGENARPARGRSSSSDGTTSRNSKPEAATASQITTIATMSAMRSHVTGLEPAAAAAERRCGQVPGRSHRSIRSVTMKNTTLTRMTKQIAA